MKGYPLELTRLDRPEDVVRLLETLKFLLAGMHIIREGDMLVVKDDVGNVRWSFDLVTGNLRIGGTISENQSF